MVETDLGKATILYEDPNEGTVEETVDNEHVAYFQDHWIVKTGEHEEGQDIVRRIPAQRVYFVERNVEEFEEEVGSLLDDVDSFANGIGVGVQRLRDRLETVTGDLQSEFMGDTRDARESESEVHRIDIEEDVPDEEDDPGEDGDRDR